MDSRILKKIVKVLDLHLVKSYEVKVVLWDYRWRLRELVKICGWILEKILRVFNLHLVKSEKGESLKVVAARLCLPPFT